MQSWTTALATRSLHPGLYQAHCTLSRFFSSIVSASCSRAATGATAHHLSTRNICYPTFATATTLYHGNQTYE